MKTKTKKDWIRDPLLTFDYKGKYGEEMDPEVVDLCNAMNSLPGIETFNSCCGHGKNPFHIWFEVDPNKDPRLQGLFFLTRCVDHRYWAFGHIWRIELSVGDMYDHADQILPTHYLLTSGKTKGELAYDQAKSLVKNMEEHLNHKSFFNGFDLELKKFKIPRPPISIGPIITISTFKDLQIGDTFYCYGDTHLNYNYPKYCQCTKVDSKTGQEVDGIRFGMDDEDEVQVKKLDSDQCFPPT